MGKRKNLMQYNADNSDTNVSSGRRSRKLVDDDPQPIEPAGHKRGRSTRRRSSSRRLSSRRRSNASRSRRRSNASRSRSRRRRA